MVKKLKGNSVGKRHTSGVFITNSSLDWYKLTESTRHILNIVITKASKERLKESEKLHPDSKRIAKLSAISLKAIAITRDTAVFQSKERMQEVMDEYLNLDLVSDGK